MNVMMWQTPAIEDVFDIQDDLNKHLRRARGGVGVPEYVRSASFRTLIHVYQMQLVREGAAFERWQARGTDADAADEAEFHAAEVDGMLADFFTRMNRMIWTSDDPVAAMKRLVGGARRGPRAKNADRDFELAVKVAELVHDGRTADAAMDAVRHEMPRRKLSPERIKALWREYRQDAELEDVLRRPWLGRGVGNSAGN